VALFADDSRVARNSLSSNGAWRELTEKEISRQPVESAIAIVCSCELVLASTWGDPSLNRGSQQLQASPDGFFVRG